MPKSSITKLLEAGVTVRLARNSEFSQRLGATIRARRRALGMTQTQLGKPYTKGFVSEVERGRSLPSLPALALMAERLAIPMSYLLDEVKAGLPAVYTPRDDNDHSPSPPRR